MPVSSTVRQLQGRQGSRQTAALPSQALPDPGEAAPTVPPR